MEYFRQAFNHKEARESGKIIPKKGVDEDYDKAKMEKQKLEEDLKDYLKEQKRHFGCDVKYFGTGNNLFQIEVPDHIKACPSKYTIQKSRKGFQRYVTKEILEFRQVY